MRTNRSLHSGAEPRTSAGVSQQIFSVAAGGGLVYRPPSQNAHKCKTENNKPQEAMAVKTAAKAPNTEESRLAAMGRTVQEIVAAMARGMAAMVG